VPYLLDTDVLVASKRMHYHPDFCQLFWDWIDAGHSLGVFFSLDKVKDELMSGNEDDLLRQWCKRPGLSDFFLPSKVAVAEYAVLANWVAKRQPAYLPAALSKFLAAKGADAWLVAAAANKGLAWKVVTNEVSAPESKKDVKLPDAAASLNIETISLSQLLRKHAKSNFQFAM
jgi:hypothetical protein